MRVSTGQLFNQNIGDLNRKSAEFSKLQTQISRETKILTPADNPADAVRIIDINRTLERNEQYNQNGILASNRLKQSETTLDAASQTVDRIKGLVFSSPRQNFTDRQQLAQQIRGELSTLTSLSNTRDSNGDYLYAGHDVNTQPFTVNGAGNVVYNGDQGQRNIQIAENRRVADGNSGFEIFENISSGQSVFATIENIITTLENPASTQAAVQAAVTSTGSELNAVKETFNSVRNSVASRLHTITREEEIHQELTLQLQNLEEELKDHDRAEAILQLNELQVSIQAAQQTFVRTRELSLFNLL